MKKYVNILPPLLVLFAALACGGNVQNGATQKPGDSAQAERIFPPGGSLSTSPGPVVVPNIVPVASSLSLIEGFESGIPAGWTLSGVGGTSGAVNNLAPAQGSQFGYIDNRGGTSTGAYGGTAGTTLQSAPISLSAGSVLTLKFSFMTNDGAGFNDFAFIQLRDANTNAVVATLASANTSGSSSPAVPAQGAPAPAISPGVSLSPFPAYFNGLSTGPIGGDNYGPGKFGGGNGGSTGWVTVTYTVPATGSYRLFFLVTDVGDTSIDTGLAFDEIGLVYDMIFTDNTGASRVKIVSATGTYLWEILNGGVVTNSYPGNGAITMLPGYIYLKDGTRLKLTSNRSLGFTTANFFAPGVGSVLTDSHSFY